MSFEQKKEFAIKCFLKAYNFNDPTATTLDWSSSMPSLHVSSHMVLTVLRTLDFNRICSELVGKKTVKEMFVTVFNFLKKNACWIKNF